MKVPGPAFFFFQLEKMLLLFQAFAGKLVLPAMIVTDRNFLESVKQLGDSVKALPEIATFEIGIRPLTFIAVLCGVLGTVILFFLSPFIAVPFAFTYFLLLIMAVNYINSTYYTILYLTLIEKKKIKGFSPSF